MTLFSFLFIWQLENGKTHKNSLGNDPLIKITLFSNICSVGLNNQQVFWPTEQKEPCLCPGILCPWEFSVLLGFSTLPPTPG